MPRTLVLQQAFQSAQWVLWTGLISLALALLFLSVILRRQIARPVGQLLEVTRRMGAGEAGVRVQMDRQDELGRLASAFNLMAQSVAERDAALRQLNQNLERRVEERTTELKGSEARLRTIIEHNPEAVVVFDVDANRFIEVNESAVRMFGLPREKLLQIGPLEVSPTSQPDGRPSKDSAREKIQAALAGHTPPFEWTHRTGDGIDLPCEVRLARVPVDSCNRIIATLIDITERKQAETGLLKALAREKELGELKSNFVSMVSHEFRTPLEIIISSADILQRYLDRLAPEKRLSYLEAIQTSVKRMDKVMEEVLLLSKVEAGGIEFKPVLFDLPAFCRRTADEILFATKHRNPIQLHIDGVPDEVHGDEALLRPVFLNLLSNAVKYSPPGKAVKFEVAFKPDGPTEFRVSDQGCGIPPADQERLFQAFHRGRNVGQIPGTGLGLVIVKRCLELHGGEIRCDSTEGAGTIFTVTVALAQTAEALSCGARS